MSRERDVLSLHRSHSRGGRGGWVGHKNLWILTPDGFQDSHPDLNELSDLGKMEKIFIDSVNFTEEHGADGV